jgi:hypothetical protein
MAIVSIWTECRCPSETTGNHDETVYHEEDCLVGALALADRQPLAEPRPEKDR